MDPVVTIIIPTHNRQDYLPLALESAISQTFTDYEILILDDASTDNTHEIVSPYLEDKRIRYIKHPKNIGVVANRNYGLSISKGQYIAMLDSDDLWLEKDKIQRQKDILDTHPEYGIVGTYTKVIDSVGEEIGKIVTHSADSSIRKNMLIRNQFVQSSIFIRKSALDEVGFYDEAMLLWEDYELWLRIGEKYKFRNIPEILTGYRKHTNNISKSSEEKSIKSYILIYKLYRKKYPFSIVILAKIIIKKLLFNLKHFS